VAFPPKRAGRRPSVSGAAGLFLPTCTAQQQRVRSDGGRGDAHAHGTRLRRLRKCTFTSPQKVSAERLEVLHLWEHQKREASRALCLDLLCQEEEMHGGLEDEDAQLLLMSSGSGGRMLMRSAEEEGDADEEVLQAYKRSIAHRLSVVPKRRMRKMKARRPALSSYVCELAVIRIMMCSDRRQSRSRRKAGAPQDRALGRGVHTNTSCLMSTFYRAWWRRAGTARKGIRC
jgi:hypothetical protein